MPMVLLEAMAAQKPIVATNVGATSKLIENNKTGLLIEPKDMEGICAAVGLILTNSEKAKLLALNAFEKVKSEFSSSIMAQKYLEVYNEVLNNGRFN
jgi:glycosyltransferase involved in cell wall biosynthesis